MKKISMLGLFCAGIIVSGNSFAGYDDGGFRSEVQRGIDVASAMETVDTRKDAAIGELGMDVYETRNEMTGNDLRIYIPTTMYIRGGAGINLGFASDKAGIGTENVSLSGGWGTQIGLGWNKSSYVRTEIDFQTHHYGFEGYNNAIATSNSVGGTLYFDFLRRYITTGDVVRRRHVVPFMGLGSGIGTYEFQGLKGASGMFVAPRAIFGLNIMMTDLIGVDLAYQYQMFIGNGFGWNIRPGGVQSLGDLNLSFRVNF